MLKHQGAIVSASGELARGDKLNTKMPALSTESAKDITEAPDELVFAFVCAVGTQAEPIQAYLCSELRQAGYRVEPIIKLSEFFRPQLHLCGELELTDDPYFARVSTRMDVGNKLRESSRHEDIAARLAITAIHQQRPRDTNYRARPRTAYVLSSLKREEEVRLLRDVYGPGFFLIAVYAPEEERLLFLNTQRSVPEVEARRLIERDRDETNELHGQRTSDTYAMADVFIPQDPNLYKHRISRFVDLVFGHPFHTPTQDEHGMFLAYSASLRSGDLSRQVGAALTTTSGDVLALGCNDVPRFGGGLYWPGPADQRDHVRGSDSNEKRRDEIIRDILHLIRADSSTSLAEVRTRLGQVFEDDSIPFGDILADDSALNKLRQAVAVEPSLPLQRAKELLQDTPLFSLTEFGRTVHAEMDALFACARTGRSPVNAVLFTTTFPCHNCTRHIVTSGVSRVVYIEPYPKSLAFRLHFDSIFLNERGLSRPEQQNCKDKVTFEPFLGVGPRRFFDLFSLKLSSGRALKRKEKRGSGETVEWQRFGERPRVPLEATSYLEKERAVAVTIPSLLPPKQRQA